MALNVNKATKEELEALPGVGSATAAKMMRARPIKGGKELEELIPPSAWLKIQEGGVEFAFGEADRDPADNDVEGPQPRGEDLPAPGPVPPEPSLKVLSPEPMVLKRLVTRADRPDMGLKFGAEYLCVWNVRHGPAGEAYFPEDGPTEAYVAQWFRDNGMAVKFAHWMPSVQLATPNRGLVNLVLFEILKEETNAQDGEGNEEGGN